MKLCLVDTFFIVVLIGWVLGASLIGEVESCEYRRIPVTLKSKVLPIGTVVIINIVFLEFLCVGIEEIDT